MSKGGIDEGDSYFAREPLAAIIPAVPGTDQRSALEIDLSPIQIDSICKWWQGMSVNSYGPAFVEGMLHGYAMALPYEQAAEDLTFLRMLSVEMRGGYDFIMR